MAADECGLCLRCRPDLYRKTPKTSVAGCCCFFVVFFTALKNWVMVHRKTPLPLPPPPPPPLLPIPPPPPPPPTPPHPGSLLAGRERELKASGGTAQPKPWTTTCRPADRRRNAPARDGVMKGLPRRRKKLGRLAHPTHKHKHVSPLPSGFRYAQLAAHSKPRFLALFVPALP